VQAKLGASRAGTFDINCACAAWVTGMDLAARYIATDPEYRHILVAAGYGMTKFLDWSDKYTCTLFADGAAAAVLESGPQPGFLAGKLLAQGQYHDALGIYTGGTFRPASLEVVQQSGKPVVQFVKKFPATFNSDNWPPLIHAVLAKAGIALDAVDQFYFTQLNLRTIEAVMAILGQPLRKTHWIMDKWGYLGSACIPAALDDAMAQAKGPKPGELVMFCASGGGMAMAASLWRWTAVTQM
jgi:3-oxoacyl-[acyl-carrier-protein] synthase-3